MRSIQNKSWSSFKKNITIDQTTLMQDNITAVAAISSMKGLVHLTIQDEGVNRNNFPPWVEQLSNKMKRQPFVLFMD